MVRITRSSPNRLDIEFSGKIDAEGMKIMLDEMIAKAEGIDNGRMLFTSRDFNMPTLAAIGVELSRLPQLFRFINQFDRVAILADKKWVGRTGEIEGALIPGLEVKAFEPGQEAQADGWLRE